MIVSDVDQRAGATSMSVTGMAVTVPLLLTVVWRWASTEERIAASTAAERASGSAGAEWL